MNFIFGSISRAFFLPSSWRSSVGDIADASHPENSLHRWHSINSEFRMGSTCARLHFVFALHAYAIENIIARRLRLLPRSGALEPMTFTFHFHILTSLVLRGRQQGRSGGEINENEKEHLYSFSLFSVSTFLMSQHELTGSRSVLS